MAVTHFTQLHRFCCRLFSRRGIVQCRSLVFNSWVSIQSRRPRLGKGKGEALQRQSNFCRWVISFTLLTEGHKGAAMRKMLFVTGPKASCEKRISAIVNAADLNKRAEEIEDDEGSECGMFPKFLQNQSRGQTVSCHKAGFAGNIIAKYSATSGIWIFIWVASTLHFILRGQICQCVTTVFPFSFLHTMTLSLDCVCRCNPTKKAKSGKGQKLSRGTCFTRMGSRPRLCTIITICKLALLNIFTSCFTFQTPGLARQIADQGQ